MAEAYIIDTVRTPVGRRGGSLAEVHPADLGAHTLKALMERTGVDPSAVEDVGHRVIWSLPIAGMPLPSLRWSKAQFV